MHTNGIQLLGLVFLLLGWSSPCSAESVPIEHVQKPFADKWAVVIGVDKFCDASWNLRYAVKDARDFRDYLVTQANFEADHVKLLVSKGATSQSIAKALREWLGTSVGPDDLAIIYIRSRGSFAKLDAAGRHFLVASDTKADRIASTGIEMDEFPKSMLESVRARSVIMIIDADFSGVMTNATSINGGYDFPPRELVPSGGFQILCSASAHEISWESKNYSNSVFTRHLIDALVQGGKLVTLPGAADSIREAVGREVREARNRSQYVSTFGISDNGLLNVRIAAPSTKLRSAP